MSTLRRRPAALRAVSDIIVPSSPSLSSPCDETDTDGDDDALPSSARLFPPAPSPSLSRRRRSHSLHSSLHPLPSHPFPRTHAALEYGSSLLESLDLPASLLGLREYLLGKVASAEQGLERLRELVEESEADGDGETEDELDEEGDRAGRSVRSTPATSRAVSPSRADADDTEFAFLEDDLSTLHSFISSATSFLSALRAELPSLPSSTSLASPTAPAPARALVQLHLSPDARAALDRFLADHPLPSFPASLSGSGVRAKAREGAAAVLARVSDELRGVRDAMASLTVSTPSDTRPGEDEGAAPSMAAYLHSAMPSPPAMPDLASVRAYFSAESTRLGTSLAHLTSDASSSLSSGLHTLTAKAEDALDEARRMYHEALEAGKSRLLRYEELPVEWRNNEHLLDGYRYIPIERWGALLKSGVQWHNETVNIQSHFLGALSLCILLYSVLSPSSTPSGLHGLANPHTGDTAIAVLFVLSAMHCLLCSAAWHLLAGCATSHWFRGAACVDYVGISGLIAASVMGAEYYGFYSHPRLATGYMIFSGIVGITGMIVPWQAWFNQREHKMWRVAFFCSLAASAVAPIAHRMTIYGWINTFWFYSPAIPSVAAYIVGLLFYSNQFPECCRPGSWNFGASHQWWHFSIVAAIYLHWKAMTDWSATVALAELAGVDTGVALGAH
ncbi:hypothetical protein JCM10207_002494 [Rhodosporidiobolus poonsookiae]